MRHYPLAIIGTIVLLLSAGTAYAVNVAVPQSTAFGDILRGNANGTYSTVATSSLGLPTAAYPFVPSTNYGVTQSATTTPIWAQGGLYASTTGTAGVAIKSTSFGRALEIINTGTGPGLWMQQTGTNAFLITAIAMTESANAIDIAHNPANPTLATTKTFSLANNFNARGILTLFVNNGTNKTLEVDNNDTTDYALAVTSQGFGQRIIANGASGTSLPFVVQQGGTATSTIFQINSAGTASTTGLTISGLGSGSTQCLQISGAGAVSGTGSACGAGGSSFAYPFPNNATTTVLTLSGLVSIASTTISASTTITGALTASGGIYGALTGNASTATALAANGTNCSAGSYPLGVDASGNAENCTVVTGGSTGTLSTETPAGTINGSNTVFTTANQPALVELNGGYQTAGGTDYTLTGTGPYTITFVNAPPTSSVLVSLYGNAVSNLLTQNNWWLARQNFTTASTSQFTATSSVWFTGVTASRPLYVDANGLVGSAGSGVSGNCMQWGANNTLADAGSPCGSGGSSFAYPFVTATNFGVTTQSTTTAPWFKAGLFASSTAPDQVWVDQLSIGSTTSGTLATSTDYGNFVIKGNASTTNLTISGLGTGSNNLAVIRGNGTVGTIGLPLAVANGGTGISAPGTNQLVYSNGAGIMATVATSSASCSGGTSCSSFTVVGSTAPTITSFAWPFSLLSGTATSTGLGIFASTTIGNGTATGGLTISGTGTTTNLTITSVTGTQCLHTIGGVVSGTGSDCGAGGSSFAYPFPADATTTTLTFGTIKSTLASTTNLTISGLGNTATNCLQISSAGVVSSTGSACGGAGSTPGGSLTNLQFNDTGSTFGGASLLDWIKGETALTLGTSTSASWANLTIGTSTRPQLALVDNTKGSAQWNFRSVGGFLYLATSSPGTFATSSLAAMTIAPNGSIQLQEFSIATSTNMTVDWTAGNQQLVKYGTAAVTISFSNVVAGSSLTLETCVNVGATGGAITFSGAHYSGGVQPGNTTTSNQCDFWFFRGTLGTTTTAYPVLTGQLSGVQ